jgi:NAD(P)-dependent dehydrogenase (short-subunit alcohol dehydrogenase family)
MQHPWVECGADGVSRDTGTCTSLPADLTTDAACRALAAEVRARSCDGQLHVLVNNAGATWGAELQVRAVLYVPSAGRLTDVQTLHLLGP